MCMCVCHSPRLKSPQVQLLKLFNMNMVSVLSCLTLVLAAAAAQEPRPCGEYRTAQVTTSGEVSVFVCVSVLCGRG